MITRIMLSLKKAGASQGDQWSLGEPTTLTSIGFVGGRDHMNTTCDGIPLDTLRSKGRERV